MSESKTVIAALDRIAQAISAGGGSVGAAAQSDPREEVIVRYTVGKGQFSPDGKYSVLRMKMYKLDGTEDGTHDGVWEPQGNLADAFEVPAKPTGALDAPAGPIEHVPPRAFTKAIWTFGDEEKSSITAVGPAMLLLNQLKDGSVFFLVTVAAIITNGTGRYAGARGVKTALGSTFVSSLDQLTNPPPEGFDAVTVETFRVIRAEHL